MEPGIYIDTKPAPGGFFHGKNHLYIVYRDAAGNASVIRGGPESFASIPTGGDIAVEAGAPLAEYSPRAHPGFDNDLRDALHGPGASDPGGFYPAVVPDGRQAEPGPRSGKRHHKGTDKHAGGTDLMTAARAPSGASAGAWPKSAGRARIARDMMDEEAQR